MYSLFFRWCFQTHPNISSVVSGGIHKVWYWRWVLKQQILVCEQEVSGHYGYRPQVPKTESTEQVHLKYYCQVCPLS